MLGGPSPQICLLTQIIGEGMAHILPPSPTKTTSDQFLLPQQRPHQTGSTFPNIRSYRTIFSHGSYLFRRILILSWSRLKVLANCATVVFVLLYTYIRSLAFLSVDNSAKFVPNHRIDSSSTSFKKSESVFICLGERTNF